MVKSKIKPPLLIPGKYSVMMAETETGIILTIEGAYRAGFGKVFKVFSSKKEAEEFCRDRIKASSEKEYIIYDWKRKRIGYFNPYVLKKG